MRGGGVAGEKLDSLSPENISEIISPVVITVVLRLPVDGESVVVILGVPHQPHPPVPAGRDVLVTPLLLSPVLIEIFPSKHRPGARVVQSKSQISSEELLTPSYTIETQLKLPEAY